MLQLKSFSSFLELTRLWVNCTAQHPYRQALLCLSNWTPHFAVAAKQGK